MLSKAISITAQAFEGIKDKGGAPYILHCLTVMNGVKYLGEDAMCVAVMHDLIEDIDEITMDTIIRYKFNQTICYSLGLLSHNPNMDYMDYIKMVGTDFIATAVKMADLRHNTDILRMKGIRKKDFERLEKYHRAFMYLQKQREIQELQILKP